LAGITAQEAPSPGAFKRSSKHSHIRSAQAFKQA